MSIDHNADGVLYGRYGVTPSDVFNSNGITIRPEVQQLVMDLNAKSGVPGGPQPSGTLPAGLPIAGAPTGAGAPMPGTIQPPTSQVPPPIVPIQPSF